VTGYLTGYNFKIGIKMCSRVVTTLSIVFTYRKKSSSKSCTFFLKINHTIFQAIRFKGINVVRVQKLARR
jgi:hypothetical protein